MTVHFNRSVKGKKASCGEDLKDKEVSMRMHRVTCQECLQKIGVNHKIVSWLKDDARLRLEVLRDGRS